MIGNAGDAIGHQGVDLSAASHGRDGPLAQEPGSGPAQNEVRTDRGAVRDEVELVRDLGWSADVGIVQKDRVGLEVLQVCGVDLPAADSGCVCVAGVDEGRNRGRRERLEKQRLGATRTHHVTRDAVRSRRRDVRVDLRVGIRPDIQDRRVVDGRLGEVQRCIGYVGVDGRVAVGADVEDVGVVD